MSLMAVVTALLLAFVLPRGGDVTTYPAVEPARVYAANDAAPWGVARVGIPQAWAMADGAGVVVAVVDSGVDAAHPDLTGRVLPGHNLWDRGDASDGCGHGTHLAGIVAAIAPQASILPVKVMADECYGTYSRLAEGIIYAADAGADIVLVASGGYYDSAKLREAVEYARGRDVLVVAAAGNGASSSPFYPAAYAFAVSGTDRLDWPYYLTDHGPHIAVAAPAVEIWCATPGGGYAIRSGTSMAAAHVAGVAALVRAQWPNLTALEVGDLVRTSADDCGVPGRDDWCGDGRVSAWRAIAPTVAWLPVVTK